jgi:hypothetical protein
MGMPRERAMSSIPLNGSKVTFSISTVCCRECYTHTHVHTYIQSNTYIHTRHTYKTYIHTVYTYIQYIHTYSAYICTETHSDRDIESNTYSHTDIFALTHTNNTYNTYIQHIHTCRIYVLRMYGRKHGTCSSNRFSQLAMSEFVRLVMS